ncbi:MAG: nitrile hydratase subunit alpha [Gammaproteobacteria bacterium]|nr:MAG: nitrile hydratase subunit alpha [Gammaproteobacteria bacterium]
MSEIHEHGTPEIALRVEALESLLQEKGLLDPAAVDAVIRYFEQDIGPLKGARLVARAWLDPAFKARLLEDPAGAGGVVGVTVLEHLVVVENTPETHNVVVCSLCSCYPWSVLGLPPSWYKSPAYRARVVREPRAVLAEIGLSLPEDMRVRVWDSSSEVRYMVLPMRPAGTEHLGEDALAALVTRDSMIGVAVPRLA